MTDGFGPRWGRMHLGIDVGILTSPTVRASAPGTVTAAGYLGGYEGYGNVVIVDVGRGYTMLYAHLAATAVRPGDWLELGEPLGTAGCTGSCTGTHLHFELRRAGVPVDPSPSSAKIPRARAVSSVGRAPARQAGGHWFEPSTAHREKAPETGPFSFSEDDWEEGS